MKRLAEAIRAYNEAAERLKAAADAIDEAADDISEEDAAKLRTAYDEAKTDAESRKKQVDELQEIADARDAHPVIDSKPEPEVRDKDGNTVLTPANSSGYAGYAFRGRVAETVRVTREPLTYERGVGLEGNSFFWDLAKGLTSKGVPDEEARKRLFRHMEEMHAEKRTNISQTAGQGGEFIPPLWMQDEWIRVARAGRPFANAIGSKPLPGGTNQINFPSLAGGGAVAVQSDAGAVQSTDPTTGSVTAQYQTIAGQVDLSRQLLDFSVPGMDEVIFDDLARAYAAKLDTSLLNGTVTNAKGIIQTSSINSNTYTDASPTGPELYPFLGGAISKIATNRFLPPDLWVMHPRRWYWLMTQTDTSGRPLVVPRDYANFNAYGLGDAIAAEAIVGTLLGLPVCIDSQIPTTNGAGTNEDQIVCTRTADNYFYEEPAPRMRLFEEVLSNTLQIRVQVFGYYAYTAARYPKATCLTSGTGLTAPTGF